MAMSMGSAARRVRGDDMTIRVRESSVLDSMCITASYCDRLTLHSAAMCLSQATLYTEVRHKVVFA